MAEPRQPSRDGRSHVRSRSWPQTCSLLMLFARVCVVGGKRTERQILSVCNGFTLAEHA